LINIHIPGQEPKPVPKRKLGQQEVVIPDLSIQATQETPTNVGFGTEFPKNPNKGDMFLRVDILPNKLYKWNETKWIEIDKKSTDSYSYDEKYIKHLIDKIENGEYDIDMLNDAELEQIEKLKNGN
jgi:hypothetical protein